jgi:malate synthase
MEDTATAEISRAQLWQWRQQGARLADGRMMTAALYEQIRDEELAQLEPRQAGDNCLQEAAAILDRLVLDETFSEFLTFIAYDYLK